MANKVLGDTQTVSQWEVTGELRRRLIRAFPEENVRVPFPARGGGLTRLPAVNRTPAGCTAQDRAGADDAWHDDGEPTLAG